MCKNTMVLKCPQNTLDKLKKNVVLKKRENYNKGNGKSKDLICPEDKEQAIIEAFKHFGMLN